MATKLLANKVGPWVVGDEFWDREHEVEQLVRLLDENHHLLLVAPRRIGKTSLVREVLRILDARGTDYTVFADLQGCSSPEEFVVALSMATMRHKPVWKKVLLAFKTTLGDLLARIDTVDADVIQLKLRESTVDGWQMRADRVLEGLAAVDRPVVVCLDELPVMLTRLLDTNREEVDPARVATAQLFLSWLRKACDDHAQRIRFVLCGSIGLEPIAHRYHMSHTIAHLRPFPVEPWSDAIADGCLAALAARYGLTLSGEARRAMLDRLGCAVPHHVQMYFGHLLDACRRDGDRSPTPERVARIYEQHMLGVRGHAELVDYEERLLRVLGPDLRVLALSLLTEAAVAGALTRDAATRIAADEAGADPGALRVVLDVLEHDGYLRPDPGGAGLVFVSGLVRDWWRKRFGADRPPARGQP
jgi:hypothetical protein